MKIQLSLLAFCLAGFGLVHAQTPIPAPPQLNAKGYVLLDYHSGQVLAESKANESLEPASITKLMTAYVVFDALKHNEIQLTDLVTVSEKAWRMEGSRMFIEVGKTVEVEKLLQGMIVQSGNDATIALVEHVSGSEAAFVERMNATAKKLGMHNTHYTNTTGLPQDTHLTTGQDIATLAKNLITDFPEEYHWYSQKAFSYNDIEQSNRNGLLWRDERVDGMKTGYTKNAGYCLVASAKRDHMRLISVVLGTPSNKVRLEGSQALLNYGFRYYQTYRLYEADKPLTTAKVYKGVQPTAELGVQQDVLVTIPSSEYEQLQASIDVNSILTAPLDTQQSQGQLQVRLRDELIYTQPIRAIEPIRVGGLFKRAKDEVKLWFK